MNKNNNCVIKVSKDDKIILEYIKSETNASYSKIISILLKSLILVIQMRRIKSMMRYLKINFIQVMKIK